MVSCRMLVTSRWGFFLQIDQQRSVRGVREKDDDCVFEMKTTDFAKVTIRGVQSNIYVAMNDQGNLYTTDTQNPSCVWKEIHHTDGYNYYESDQHNGFFLALKRRGDPKNGRSTALGQVSCAFLVTTITHEAT
ncbi:fibroblast growth factor 7-like [Stylophora pistillata]|uniref:fibroblast growth factor 7-like n=1 Tax=Stylophora pistillata TaxID=50429 RepID=UPI000C04B606|nr:fibroblast growth factor 7-like [Stylophora pistillata]